METRETVVESGEENLKIEEKNFSDKLAKLRLEQAAAKLEDKRLKALKKEQEEKRVTGAGAGLPPGLTDILLQQKTLLEKQVKIEEERGKSEKDEKRDKQSLIGKGIKTPNI